MHNSCTNSGSSASASDYNWKKSMHHSQSSSHDSAEHLREIQLPSTTDLALAGRGPRVWSFWMYATALLLAANDNAFPHYHSGHLCNLCLQSPDHCTLEARAPHVRSRRLLCNILLLDANYNSLPNDNTWHMCDVFLPAPTVLAL